MSRLRCLKLLLSVWLVSSVSSLTTSIAHAQEFADYHVNSQQQRGGMFSTFFGLDGSKQPQDFGVNANLGGRFSLNYAAPLLADQGIGIQIGSAVTASANAVQVYELLGESSDRLQSFSTVGIFQRTPSGFGWGAVYDHLYQDSFDTFNLGQVRLRGSWELTTDFELGTTFNIATQSSSGQFNATPVSLEPIEMLNVYAKRQWQTGVMTTIWIGVADGHNESRSRIALGFQTQAAHALTFC